MAEGFAGARNGQQFECALPVAADRAKEIDFHLRPSGKPQMFRLRGPVWSYTPGAAIATCALAKAFTLTPELSIHGVQVGFSESAQYSIEQKNDVATRILDSALSLQLPPPSMANLASDLRVVSTGGAGSAVRLGGGHARAHAWGPRGRAAPHGGRDLQWRGDLPGVPPAGEGLTGGC